MREIIACFLISIFLASCSSSDRLVSIRDHPPGQYRKIDYLQWKTGSESWLCAGGRYSSASGFVHNFAAYGRGFHFPFAAWAVKNKRTGQAQFMENKEEPCFEYPDHQPWAEALKRIGIWAGPYRTKIHSGFIEIVWAADKDEKKIRGSMQKWVPPIVFQSRNTADYLEMWHAVSGMDFRYDPDLLTVSSNYDRKRLIEESDPAISLTETPVYPFPLGFLQFETSERLAVDDFMHKLAAHIGGLANNSENGWLIEKFQRNKQGLQLIEDCIARLKKDFHDSAEPVEILSRIGTPALPEILREFRLVNNQHDSFINWDAERFLITILSRISSPERDEALLNALKEILGGTRWKMNLHDIIEALASSNCQAAAPMIEQIANSPKSEPETRLAARVALNALGRPTVLPGQEKAPDVISSAQKAINTDSGKQAMALLCAVLNQCDEYSTGMQLRYADVSNPNMFVLRGYYRKRADEKQSWWMFEVPVLRPDRAFVRFSYVCGELCSGGFLGRLKKQNGRWIVTKWQRQWIS